MTRWLLDTVTVSELRKLTRADAKVRDWIKNIEASNCWLSVITLTEIRNGILLIRPRDAAFADQLEDWYQDHVIAHFSKRLIAIDRQIAELAAEYTTIHRLTIEDAFIAATAKIHGLTLATRNTADFEITGISLYNPWEPAA